MTTLNLTPQYITDNKGKPISVVLSIETFDRLIEMLEDLEDVKLYDEVKNRNEETISLSDYLLHRKARSLSLKRHLSMD